MDNGKEREERKNTCKDDKRLRLKPRDYIIDEWKNAICHRDKKKNQVKIQNFQ